MDRTRWPSTSSSETSTLSTPPAKGLPPVTKALRRFLLLAKAPLLLSTPPAHLITITLATTTTTTTISLPGLEAQHPMLANLTRPSPHMGTGYRRWAARQAHNLWLNSNN